MSSPASPASSTRAARTASPKHQASNAQRPAPSQRSSQDSSKQNRRLSTIVHETVAPAVTHEHLRKEVIEEGSVELDRAIHQAHYHTSVQPIQDAPQTLPAKHETRVHETEHREFHEGDDEAVKARLRQEQARFMDTRTEETEYRRLEGKTVEHERLHHHVYEQIQPVIQREIVAPTVIHSTQPIHEVVYREPQHHAASALPAISMAEFKRQGGVLGGRGERRDEFEGEPVVEGKRR